MNTIPFHPFMTGQSLQSAVDCDDAINRCVAALNLLSELFASNADDYEFLNTPSARMGMYFQLEALASVLDAVSHYNAQRARS